MLNAYLDNIYANLLDCNKQLTAEFKLITAHNIKAHFLGEDEQHKTLIELVDYHNKNMQSVLKFGTLKKYYTTEKYLKKVGRKPSLSIFKTIIDAFQSYLTIFCQHILSKPVLLKAF